MGLQPAAAAHPRHLATRSHVQNKLSQRRLADEVLRNAAAGIWRTVWMEPVPAAHLTRLSLVPGVDTSTLSVTAYGSAAAVGGCVTATAFDAAGNAVASSAGAVGQPFVLAIPHARLWSPESPYLYDLTVALQPQGLNPGPACAPPAVAAAPGAASAPRPARYAPLRRMLATADPNPDVNPGAPAQAPGQGDVVRS